MHKKRAKIALSPLQVTKYHNSLKKELLEIHLRTGFITIIHNASPPFLLEIELRLIITVFLLQS